jgi:hypothetical protein
MEASFTLQSTCPPFTLKFWDPSSPLALQTASPYESGATNTKHPVIHGVQARRNTRLSEFT